MATVHERIYIEAPYTQAVVAFERRLGIAVGADAGICALTLVLPTLAGHDVARVATAATQRLAAEANYTTRYAITWGSGSVDGVPTPGFSGTLTLSAGESYHETRLEMNGSYKPPGGFVGDLFDDAVGGRIAHASLSALLDEVGRVLHHDHEEVEAAKAVARAAD